MLTAVVAFVRLVGVNDHLVCQSEVVANDVALRDLKQPECLKGEVGDLLVDVVGKLGDLDSGRSC